MDNKKDKKILLAEGLLERYKNKNGKLSLEVGGVVPQTKELPSYVKVYIEEVKP